MRAIAAGHPNVRATHAKTLELSRDAEIGPGATCVVGVSAEIDDAAVTELRGRVEITIEAGGRSARVRGRMNPAFQPGDPLVVRRAAAVTRDAVVIDADAAAADLDRGLVEELARPGAPIVVTINELPDERTPGALVIGMGKEDLTADLLLRSPLRPSDAANALEALGVGQRVALVTKPDDEAAAGLIAAAHDGGHDVLPAPGLEPRDALFAVAGLDPGRATEVDAREHRPGDTPWADATVVANIPADRLSAWLDAAADAGAARGVVGLDVGTPREQFLAWRAGEQVEVPGARGRTAMLVASAAAAGQGDATGDRHQTDTRREMGDRHETGARHDVDERREAALERARHLLASGGSTRDAAALLREAGVPRREAYELALELAGRTASTSSVSRPDPRTSR